MNPFLIGAPLLHREAILSSRIEQTDTLLALRERYHNQFRSARSFGVLQQLIDSLFVSPSTTMTTTAKAMKITPAAASANIRKLIRDIQAGERGDGAGRAARAVSASQRPAQDGVSYRTSARRGVQGPRHSRSV